MSLLERCKAGDQAAWRELFARYAGKVYRWALLLGLGTTEAEDAAQEVLATAARRIETCEAEAAMTTWLYQITRRVAANARRRAWLRRWVGGGGAIDSGALVHERPADVAYELAARRCLERMPRGQAEVLVMIELVGLTREECAQILGVPTGTVASRMRRARASFRRHWDKSRAPLAGRRLEETR